MDTFTETINNGEQGLAPEWNMPAQSQSACVENKDSFSCVHHLPALILSAILLTGHSVLQGLSDLISNTFPHPHYSECLHI